MHILLLIGSIPLKAITLVFCAFISMENSDAILFKLCTEYCKYSIPFLKLLFFLYRLHLGISFVQKYLVGDVKEQSHQLCYTHRRTTRDYIYCSPSYIIIPNYGNMFWSLIPSSGHTLYILS
jgi:hypothetical protein